MVMADAATRMRAADAARQALEENGIPLSKAWFDPIVPPLTADSQAALAAIETVRYIRGSMSRPAELGVSERNAAS